MIRVVIADDHAMYREGMAVVVELDGTAEVVGLAADGEEAVAIARELRPDVVMMDVRMPGVGGIEACRRLHAADPSIRILMLTMSDDEADLFEAVAAGASGYLLKDLPGEEIAEGIRRVHDGQAVLPPGMAAAMLEVFGDPRGGAVAEPGVGHLTPQEAEVLRLVARGQGNIEIAGRLGSTEDAVKGHIRNVLDKLHQRSAVAAGPARPHPLADG